jgi:hypothetical protein
MGRAGSKLSTCKKKEILEGSRKYQTQLLIGPHRAQESSNEKRGSQSGASHWPRTH